MLLLGRCSRYRYRFSVSPFYSYQHQRDAFAIQLTQRPCVEVFFCVAGCRAQISNHRHSLWLSSTRRRSRSFGFRSFFFFNYIRGHFINTYIVQCPHITFAINTLFLIRRNGERTCQSFSQSGSHVNATMCVMCM